MEPSIVFEDDDIVAVNKPAGLTVHSDGKTQAQTLVDFVVKKYPKLETIGEPLKLSSGEIIHRAGIVHRLDKETSGLVLFAKNQNAFLFFKKQFQERSVKKEYRAIVYGLLKVKRGVIDKPIGRSSKDFRARSAEPSARGLKRPAQTGYSVISETSAFSYLSVLPQTGRTHQIRVHLKSIGHPILCDTLYAPKRSCPKEMGRLALHAYSIEIKTPSGAALRLEAPIPPDFKAALTTLNIKL
ncbi:MAG: RluA family pseudouridine synthase [Parcubacteria group bacterium]|nr:RluA family pseudouridine synthase [Parcubacteria group bacterium]